jgi:hypothetical protein
MILKPSTVRKFFLYLVQGPKFYGKAPSTPTATTQTVNQNSIPAELMPYALDVMKKGQGLTDQTYKPYSTNMQDYIAGFSPLQQQAQASANNLASPGQFTTATPMAMQAGMGQLYSAGQASGYGAQGVGLGLGAAQSASGQAGSQIGQAGGYGAQGSFYGAQAAGQAGQGYNAQANFAQQATSPGATQAYMSPYMQNVVNQQVAAANRQYDITGAQEMGQATRANAFGGSREALMAAENERARNTAISGIQAQGLQSAFENAQGQQQFGANLGIQGLNAGTNAMQAGMQGAQTGIQGVQAQTAASNMQLQGAQVGLQGIQAGLAGEQGAQQGFAGASNTAATLGNLGTAQLAADTNILNTQNTIGGQQQAQQQQAIDQSILNYQNAQQYPYMQLGFMSNLIRGTPTSNTTETKYQAQPSTMQQIGGALGTAGSLYGAATAKKAEGGSIKDNSYAQGGIVGYFGGGSVEGSMRGKLEDMTPQQLQEVIATSPSNEVRSMAKEILAQESYARGGIVAFAEKGYVEDGVQSQRGPRRPYYEEGIDYSLDDLANETDPEVRASRIEEWNKKYGRLPPPESEYIQPETTNPNLSEDKALKTLKNQPKGLETIPGEGVKRSSKEGILTKRGTGLQTIPGEEVVRPKKGLATIEGEKTSIDRTRTAERHPLRVSKEQAAWDKGRLAQDNAAKTGTAEVPKSTAWTEGEAPTGELGKNIKQGIKGAGEKIKGAGKTIGKTLMSPELLVPAAQEYRAEQFKTGEGDALTKGLQGVQAGPSVALEALQRAVLGGSTAEQFRKASPKLAAFIDETGKTVEDRFNAVKDYFTGEPSAEDKAQPSKAEGKQVATDMGVPAKPAPFVSEGLNAPNTPTSLAAPKPPQPPMGLGSSAPAGVAPPAQQPSFGGTAEESEILRANLASEPQAIEQVANTAAEVVAAKTEQDMPFYMKQVQEMYKQQGLGNNEGADAMRQEIMGELANKDAEEKRQTYLRMAEFFSHWGSTPGAPLAAGMRSLIETMPGYLEDKKEQKKLSNTLRESLSKLNEADRLEKMGMHREAMLLKKEASKDALDHKELMMKATEGKLNRESEERIAAANQGGAYSRAQLTAGRYDVEGKSDNVLVDNLQKQIVMDSKSLENLDESSIEYKDLVNDITNNREKLRILNKTTTAVPIPLTKEQSKKEWARQNNIG